MGLGFRVETLVHSQPSLHSLCCLVALTLVGALGLKGYGLGYSGYGAEVSSVSQV